MGVDSGGDERGDQRDPQLDREIPGLRSRIRGGQEPNGRRGGRTDDRDADQSKRERNRSPTPHQPVPHPTQPDWHAAQRPGVLERVSLRIGRGNLATHDSSQTPMDDVRRVGAAL